MFVLIIVFYLRLEELRNQWCEKTWKDSRWVLGSFIFVFIFILKESGSLSKSVKVLLIDFFRVRTALRRFLKLFCNKLDFT